MSGPVYLGDGAYIAQGSWAGEWELYTSNGIGKTNSVFLDTDMVAGMLRYLKAHGVDLGAIT